MITKQTGMLIASGILLLAVGGILGAVMQRSHVSQQVKAESAQILGSKVISSISAFGKVSKIQDRDITLSSLGDVLSVDMPDTVRVYSFTVAPADKNGLSSTAKQKIASFGDIKVGDSINANLKLLPTGKFQGVSVIILPSASK